MTCQRVNVKNKFDITMPFVVILDDEITKFHVVRRGTVLIKEKLPASVVVGNSSGILFLKTIYRFFVHSFVQYIGDEVSVDVAFVVSPDYLIHR